MIETVFPTFTKFLYGPTWYTATWFGDAATIQQRSLLRILAVATRERFPSGRLVELLAEEHRGGYRRKLRRLAARLNSGTALVDALEQTPDVLSDEAVLALRFGSQSGTLLPAFDMLLSAEPSRVDGPYKDARGLLGYWIVVTLAIVLSLTFMMTIITPTFKHMFNEFGLRLPPSLLALIAICDLFAQYAAVWILLAVVGIGLFWSSYLRRLLRRGTFLRFFQPVTQLRLGELLNLLALTTEAGKPLAGSLSTLARYHFDTRVRQRLLFARNEIEQGVESWQCLTQANLLTPPQAQVLAEAPSNAVRAWTLRRLAAAKFDSAQRQSSISLTLLQPVVVLIFAGIVLFIFVSFFSVLTTMINALS